MTMFIKLENGNPVGNAVIENNIRALFLDRVLPQIWTPENARELGFGIYEFTQVPTVPDLKKLVEVAPTLHGNGVYYQTWQVVDMSEEEKSAATENQKIRVRTEREFKLSRSDWTQLPDVSLSSDLKLAWTTYRQQLRDVTLQPGFPWNIAWPTPPQQ